MPYTCDVFVMGAGPGGYPAAIRAAQRGLNVVIAERTAVGGTCLNWGCIPTKALVASAEAFHTVKNAAAFGVINPEGAAIDYPKAIERKDAVVKKLTGGIAQLLKAHGVTTVMGKARLIDQNHAEVETADGIETVEFKNCIIATGSESARPRFIPFDDEKIVESKTFLSQNKLPSSVIIIGGGVVGCEFAGILAECGTKVTIVEMLDRLLPLEDPEISKHILRAFKKRKIEVMLGTGISDIAVTENGVTGKVGETTIEAEKMLVAIGRSMNTADIGLDKIGIETERGFISVDEKMRTKVPNIYAIGDITGKILLAHVATAQGIVAAENCAGKDETIDYRVVPSCIFTVPEIASVGLSEPKAIEAGHEVTIAQFPIGALGKALAMGEIEGFFRLIADAKTDELLGAQVMGAHASDIIAELALAVSQKMTAKQLGDVIHAHPSLAEGVMEAAHAIHKLCVHQAPPRER